jgi:hypothetical protein
MSNRLAIEDSVMYDMSTWAAPLAYNLEAYRFDAPLTVNTEEVTEVEVSSGLVGADGGGEAYAYVIDYGQRNAPRALAALWDRDVRVRAALSEFTTEGGRTYPAGSLIVLRGRNPDAAEELPRLLREVAEEAAVEVIALATGRMRIGNDLASTRNYPLREPRVAMLVDQPFNTYTSGQIYFLFDWETRLPVTRLRTEVLRQTAVPKFGSRYGYADLNDYDVLILPDASRLDRVFGKEERETLREWITAGGTLVTVGETAAFFTAENGFTDQRLISPERDTSAEAATLAYADRTEYFGKQNVPGTALHASLDTTHPLAFGLKPEVYTLKFGSESLRPMVDLHSVGRYAEEPSELLAAGYAGGDKLELLAGNTWAGVREIGQGKLVYLLDNPHYRMFWRGPSRLMQNAVMLVPGM